MNEEIVREVLAADESRYQAMYAGDVEALERILHQNLVYTHSDAHSDRKPGYLANIRSGKVRYRAVHRSNVTDTDVNTVRRRTAGSRR